MQNKLNIGIIIPGHLRWWQDCKENFLKNIYDISHNIDVYIDTYETVFRSNGRSYGESDKKIFLNMEQIIKLFEGINVVYYNVEKEDKFSSQETKLKNAYEQLTESKKKYDLIMRTRFDLMVENKIDYNLIYEQCSKKPNLIFIGKGGGDGLLNDMFAICFPKSFEIYVDRFKYGDVDDVKKWEGLQHGSLKQIIKHHNIEYNTDTWVFLKRTENFIQKMGV